MQSSNNNVIPRKDPDTIAQKKLQEEIALYDMNIEDDPDVANSYYMKAGVLVKLAKYVDNDTAYLAQLNQALHNYDKAIELEPDNPLYLVDRSKLYTKLHKKKLAQADITKIQEQQEQQKASDVNNITKIYIKNTIEDIEQELKANDISGADNNAITAVANVATMHATVDASIDATANNREVSGDCDH